MGQEAVLTPRLVKTGAVRHGIASLGFVVDTVRKMIAGIHNISLKSRQCTVNTLYHQKHKAYTKEQVKPPYRREIRGHDTSSRNNPSAFASPRAWRRTCLFSRVSFSFSASGLSVQYVPKASCTRERHCG